MRKEAYKSIYLRIFYVFVSMSFFSCDKEELFSKASVETNQVSSISEATAVCLGIVTSDGGSVVTTCGFCWSTSPIPTIDDDTVVAKVNTPDFTSTIKGLEPATRYYVRAFAINQGGVSYGDNLVFTTKTFSIATTPISVLMLTATSAVGGGSIISDGDSIILTVKDRGVCWSTMPSPTIENQKSSDGVGGGKFTSKMDSLTAFTTYYVRAYATNGNGTIYGNEVSFTTMSGIVGIQTNAITSITAYSAVGGGSTTTDGGAPITELGLCWNTTPNPTTEHFKIAQVGSTTTCSANLSELIPGTIYYVRSFAINCVGTSYGNEVVFTTQNGILGITTNTVSLIRANTATSGGTITSDGGAPPVSEFGICWSTSQSPTTSDNKIASGSGIGTITASMTGLTPGTAYYVRSYGINSVGTSYGNQVSFTSLNGVIGLTTSAVSSITAFTAVCGGNITSDGGATVTERGICLSTTPNPTTAGTKLASANGTGTFTISMTGLTPGTTYYVRSYSVNSIGTCYGNEVSFMTKNGVIDLTTNALTSITPTSAVCSGTITSNGGSSITSSGFCWSTTENPTIADNKTTNGSTTGTFSNSISGLSVNTSYYVRAWATNGVGISYGNQVNFSTLANKGTVTDIEGNVYNYITYGTQVWMVENLKTTKFNDGTSIPIVNSPTEWMNLTTPGLSWYNNTNANRELYGGLYNWYTVHTEKLAPKGWHVPTDAEWNTLEKYLIANGYNYDGSTTENKIAKSLASNSGWTTSNNDGAIGNDPSKNNTTGFMALPGGEKAGSTGLFYYQSNEGYWWTSTEYNTADAIPRNLNYNYNFLFKTQYPKNFGFSIRCVKNY